MFREFFGTKLPSRIFLLETGQKVPVRDLLAVQAIREANAQPLTGRKERQPQNNAILPPAGNGDS
eukprot:1973281-Prorocentrum_lima.AAC.1